MNGFLIIGYGLSWMTCGGGGGCSLGSSLTNSDIPRPSVFKEGILNEYFLFYYNFYYWAYIDYSSF
jgi:hypothetical protein